MNEKPIFFPGQKFHVITIRGYGDRWVNAIILSVDSFSGMVEFKGRNIVNGNAEEAKIAHMASLICTQILKKPEIKINVSEKDLQTKDLKIKSSIDNILDDYNDGSISLDEMKLKIENNGQ